MMLALLWLTASLPFVYAAQQEQHASASGQLSNTTEEKTESGTGSLSEYLHDHDPDTEYESFSFIYNWHDHVLLYDVFHGELISPPPEV